MKVLFINRVRQIRTLLSKGLEQRHSMFWKIVPTMFLASCAMTAVLVTRSTITDDTRLRNVLNPVRLAPLIEQTLGTSVPLQMIAKYPEVWCRDSLRVLSERILSRVLADRAGDDNANSFFQTVKTGRLAVTLKSSDGGGCTFASDEVEILPNLKKQITAVVDYVPDSSPQHITEQHDGWISVTKIALQGVTGPTLTIGLHILAPLDKLLGRGTIFRPLASFIFGTNVVTALILVFLLIRRIRRADQVSSAWAAGDLSVRIADNGKDELSRLTQKFDTMADAISNVIEFKQALAASEERNRIARDLHDTAKQRAFALNLQLSAARKTIDADSREGRLVSAALSLASQLQQDLAGVIRSLIEPAIAELGFRKVVTDSVARMLEGSEIRWSIDLPQSHEATLNAMPEVSRQLLLITLEAVANALKHARCTQCSISGEWVSTTYSWHISDNGCGMTQPDADNSKGVGMASMKLRALGLPGGTFEILSDESTGTEILTTFQIMKRGIE